MALYNIAGLGLCVHSPQINLQQGSQRFVDVYQTPCRPTLSLGKSSTNLQPKGLQESTFTLAAGQSSPNSASLSPTLNFQSWAIFLQLRNQRCGFPFNSPWVCGEA
jgi:hypothetical protein